MATRTFNLDEQAEKDLDKIRKRLKHRGKLASASFVVRAALSCLATFKKVKP